MSDLLRRLEHVCAQPLGDRPLRERLLAIIREKVAYDGHVFAMVDPVTHVGTSPFADVPMLPWAQLPELIQRRYRTPRRLGAHAVTGVWDPLIGDLGVTDTVSVGFQDKYGDWGFLELWRASGQFLAADAAVLSSLVPSVTAGLRGAVARTFVEPAEPLHPVGSAVVVLGPDLHVRSQTEAAGQALLTLLPPDEPMPPIPAAAYNSAGSLLAGQHPWGRVHLGGGRWVTVRAAPLGDDIAVSIEPSTPAERMDLMARAHGLSARETEVLGLIVAGLDSKTIAAKLVLSDHTVNDHVKAILAKTGAATRPALVSRGLGS